MLPKIPYKMEKNKSQSIPIGNLNLSCNIQPGDIAASRGISARKFPYLTTKKKDARQGGYSDVLAMTVFNGKIVTVRDEGDSISGLYIENERLCGLTGTTERQFAAINTKLVIMPDGVYIEKNQEGMTIRPLSAIYNISSADFSKTSFKASQTEKVVSSGFGGKLENAVFSVDPYESIKLSGTFYVDKGGRISVLRELKIDTQSILHSNAQIYIESGTVSLVTVYMTASFFKAFCSLYAKVQNIVFVVNGKVYNERVDGRSMTFNSNKVTFSFNNYRPEEGTITYNLESIYWKDEKNEGVSLDDNGDIIDFQSVQRMIGRDMTIVTEGPVFHGSIASVEEQGAIEVNFYSSPQTATVCSDIELIFGGWQLEFSGLLIPGDKILFSNLPDREFTVDTVAPRSITLLDADSEMCFNETALSIVIYKKVGDLHFEEINIGDAIEITGCVNTENNITFVVHDIQGDTLYASSDIFTECVSETNVTIARRVPKLDFVCERDNRLYGVSNADKTIYVSALGDPTNMYVYDGVSTDSFTVPVGGEGDFTGCCKYGEGVIFFKEDKLYKLVGSSPLDFALYSYDIDGLQKGAHKSMAVINEVLYYKGKDGIFTYAGGIPTLISENFGEHVFSDAVAGSDGVCYYVSMTEGDVNYLMAYNTRLGLWVLEDDVRCVDFARTSRGLFCATEKGEVYLMNATEDASNLEWFVRFVPFYETIEGKKIYSRLLLRVVIPAGSYIIIKMRCDDGEWREAGKIVGRSNGVVPIILPVSRCDKFELELSGRGECTILDIMREYYVGSEI